jgi:hypothetical protein
LKRDYSALELTVSAGEWLEESDAVEGWTFCTDANGNTGWVPAHHLTPENG